PKHDENFPVDLADYVFEIDGININNVRLQRYQDSYANNALGTSCAFATANYVIKPAYVDTPTVAIYPEFDVLSPEEKVVVIAHEKTHLTEKHCFEQGQLYDAIQDQHKVPVAKIHQSRSAQKWQEACEDEANLLPAVRHAEMAKLFVDVCNSNQNR